MIVLNRSRGFSLLELLVTLVVLSIGLLGIGLMQTTNLGLTKTAYSRTQAMLLASDIADRIRANENFAASYVTTSNTGNSQPGCTNGAACAGAALAVADIQDWSNRIFAEFPGGTGEILGAPSTPDACPGYTPTAIAAGFMRVVIKWGESASSTGAENTVGGGDCYQFDFVF
jgi:type IV pilus assembly protein PilV